MDRKELRLIGEKLRINCGGQGGTMGPCSHSSRLSSTAHEATHKAQEADQFGQNTTSSSIALKAAKSGNSARAAQMHLQASYEHSDAAKNLTGSKDAANIKIAKLHRAAAKAHDEAARSHFTRPE